MTIRLHSVKWLASLTALAVGLSAPGIASAQKRGKGAAAKAAPAAKADEPAKDDKGAKEPSAKEAKKEAKAKAAVSKFPEFDSLVARWAELKKEGKLDAEQAKTLAGKFASAAKGEMAAQGHFNAGTLYETAGDSNKAKSEYDAALSANPKHALSMNNIGEMLLRNGKSGESKSWFEKAIAADPTHAAPAYNNLAVLLFTEGKEKNDTTLYDKAISNLRRALAIDSESMPAYAQLALIYMTKAGYDKNKLQLAELVCKAARETNPNFAPIYNTAGVIKLRKRNVTGALKDFDKAVELDPNFVEAHLNIGAIGLSSRQYEKAQKSFEAVLKVQPNNFDATIGLGVAQRGQRKFQEAEASYKKAQQLDAKNCSIPYNLGLLYQDYLTKEDNSNLKTAQEFYRQYSSCAKSGKRVEDANRRVKDIDDTFVAIAEAAKMQAEAAAMQAEMEKMQKQQEEQMKAQQKPPEGGDKKPEGDKKPDAEKKDDGKKPEEAPAKKDEPKPAK